MKYIKKFEHSYDEEPKIFFDIDDYILFNIGLGVDIGKIKRFNSNINYCEVEKTKYSGDNYWVNYEYILGGASEEEIEDFESSINSEKYNL